MTASPSLQLGALRRRSWRWTVLLAWLAVTVVNLTAVLSVQAAPAVGPTQTEILASICHSGADETSAHPSQSVNTHCGWCYVVASGGFVQVPLLVPFGTVVEGEATAYVVSREDPAPKTQPDRISAPRAPPVQL